MYRKTLTAPVIALILMSVSACAVGGNRLGTGGESVISGERLPGGAGSDTGANEGEGAGTGQGTGTGQGAGMGQGTGAGQGAGMGQGAGTGPGQGAGTGSGRDSGVLAGSDTSGGRQTRMNLDFEPGFNISGDEYVPLSIQAKVPQYSLNADLSNIENMNQFANLTQEQKNLIAKNGFVVIPTNSEQLFYIYEDNTYKKIPGFVTTDSVLQLYHIFYDYSLRNLETEFLYEDLVQLNDSMLEQLTAQYKEAQNKEIKDSIQKMLGYFGVVSLTLEKELPGDFPPQMEALAKQEYDLIVKAQGKSVSPLFGFDIEYSLFKVRGHYTRSDELGRFFRAMSWYGVVPMPFYESKEVRDEASAMGAIVTTLALCQAPADKGVKLWENIYSTTSFYVGESDDITPYEVAQAVRKVYSDTPDINRIPDKLDEFYREIDQMREADILWKMKDAVTQKQMRFMGQRYIPDSEILQKLSDPDDRAFPCGMDVFAVFGSERAGELLEEIYKPQVQWGGYKENFELLAEKFQGQTVKEQTSNLYNGWLYCLKSLTRRVEGAYPMFMKNTAWEDKSLSTALGSWAEIRHDTILYGKQSGTECGGDEPPEILGYVEPNPEFFNRLLWLTKATRENLSDRELLSQSMQYKLQDFEEMLEFLKTCALKELNGEDLSPEEHYSLLTYGGTLEYMSSSIAESDNWYLVESDTDKNMAVIADVHTSLDTYLEAGVGTAAELYVAIPQNGKIYLTRGAVFDYFEFVSGERLTDEQWQAMIKENPPQRPPFTNSYMDEESGGDVPVPDEPYSTGC